MKYVLHFFIIACFLFFCNRSLAQNILPTQEKMGQIFGAGINISCFEKYWYKPEQILASDYVAKINTAHILGFKSVRLPIAFDLFVKADGVTFTDAFLSAITKANETARSHQLSLVLTYHYGKLEKNDRATEVERIAQMWGQLASLFKHKDTNRLFFELYNEPTIETNNWYRIAFELMKKVRVFDDNRTWIVGGTNYNSLDELLKMPIIPDKNIIYTFHFYQPYMFTHQGAPWTIDKTYLTGLPYPFEETQMPVLPNKAIGTDVGYNYKHYHRKATRKFISDRIQLVYKWYIKNNATVICTETGVMKSIKKRHRNNYLQDVFYSNNAYKLPVMVWDLDDSFSIIDKNKKELKSIRTWTQYHKNLTSLEATTGYFEEVDR